MSLEHTKPPDSLLRELNEVASHAAALVAVMQRGLNFPLPNSFPKDQLTDICNSLIALPEGTAEGARSPLDYARHRLPNIRRQYIGSDTDPTTEDAPALVRGAILDQTLTALISSVSTAFDEYRSLASEEDGEFRAEAGIFPKKGSVDRAIETSRELDEVLAAASITVNVVTEPSSQKADDLRRQIKDARGFNQLASAEIRMPRVVVGWLRKIVDALKQSPVVINKTVAGLRVGADISKIAVDRWSSFADDGIKFMFKQFHKTLDSVQEVGDVLGKSVNKTPTDQEEEKSTPEEVTQVDRASRRRAELQARVKSILDELDAFDQGHVGAPLSSRDTTENDLLTNLQELTRLSTFLRMHRQLSADQADTTRSYIDPSLGRAGHGMSKRVFARLAVIAIRRARRPLDSGEIVEEFRKIGHPIGGTHEIKIAYNRLWEAKTAGILTHIKGLGYWASIDELTPEALNAAKVVRAARPRMTGSAHILVRGRSSGRPGAIRVLSDAEKEVARKMLHIKPLSEIATYFGVSRATIRNYLREDIQALRDSGATPLRRKPSKRPNAGNRKITKRLGRPATLSPEQKAAVVAQKATGKTAQEIAAEFGVSVSVIYRQLAKHKTRSVPE